MAGLPRGALGGMRNPFGGGMRGGPMTAMHNSATQWFNGWNAMTAQPMHHNGMQPTWNAAPATNGGATASANWGDWYAAIGNANGGATGAANHYYTSGPAATGNTANAFGTFASQ